MISFKIIDPDAPNRLEATQRSWQHWIVGNILGKDISTGNILTECKSDN